MNEKHEKLKKFKRKSINLYKTTDGIICWSLNYTTDKSVQTNFPSESSATLRAKQQICMHYLSSWDSEGQLWTSGQRLKMILQWPNAKMMELLELLICYINICHCSVGHFHMCCTYVSLKTGETHIYTKKKSFNDVFSSKSLCGCENDQWLWFHV